METIFWLEELRNRLASDGQFQFKIQGSRLQQGLCPACGQKEIFGNLEKPFFLARQIPNATADAYLQSRGFALKKWQGGYVQSRLKIETDHGGNILSRSAIHLIRRGKVEPGHRLPRQAKKVFPWEL